MGGGRDYILSMVSHELGIEKFEGLCNLCIAFVIPCVI